MMPYSCVTLHCYFLNRSLLPVALAIGLVLGAAILCAVVYAFRWVHETKDFHVYQ